ncbi:D-alanyl-D-alanine carboxypeptidase/D-alanyl-D-alanine endopeptidase [Ginsengibacter hankyongi]|uniref:D-alanyl-D-alanine carboxypeptidase/D-alanyl-D-alanine endopeptidase n=1 Tax=Ginsengibacter hankyongi TaxID=2607284 RepID=UPI0019272DE1|nr:D-alanyl-D-alanine carboxypeptidase/D-alanyl-D-alanine-endopeptidase [Ginsengibacter hankyongi]
MKNLFLLFISFYSTQLFAQDVTNTFNNAYKKFAADKAFKHATISLLVINNTTGKTVTSVNTETGLAPASCQKVITACTSFELLGHNFIYKTILGYTGKIVNGVLDGDIIIKGSGDPTLGSWRYPETAEESIISEFKQAISREGITEITGHVYADESAWKGEVIPDGWIWEDIGNYYGAGARALNWRENQYDLFLKSGNKIGDTLQYVNNTPPFIDGLNFKIMATSAAKGSGDNSYIYIPENNKETYVRGTIPIDENHFSISGSMPHPQTQLAITLEAALKKMPVESIAMNHPAFQHNTNGLNNFYSHQSPNLDSIIYWFLQRSINLYGESLIKTLAYHFTNVGATDSGVNIIKNFWSKKGIEPSAINIIDGSGLSPANRVTTKTLVSVMQYARKRDWFPSFYNALPDINGIKMKSGSISDVLSYTGFIKSKKNIDYTFSFIINNYDGNANDVRKKMWALLDLLK